jgi:16S rRNA processing protein RimM
MKWFNVGKIVNTHGIRGEVRVISTTDFPEERYAVGNRLHIFMPDDKTPTPVVVASHRLHKNFNLLTFEGYFNVNDVVKFKGSILKVTGDQLGELEENEYYYHEIIGCTVVTEDGEEIGTIKEIINTGANDVWTIARKGQKDALIPYIKDIVLNIDIEERKVVIHVMEGLL